MSWCIVLAWCWHDIGVVLAWYWRGIGVVLVRWCLLLLLWTTHWMTLALLMIFSVSPVQIQAEYGCCSASSAGQSQSLWCTTFGNHIGNFSWIPAFHIWLMCKHSLPSQQFREWFSVVVVVLPSFILCISQCSIDFLWKLYFMCQSCLVLHFLAANGSANNWEM